MTHEVSSQDIADLRDTLKSVQERGRKYVDFTNDVTTCNWNKVWEQLSAAQEAATKREARNQRNPVRKMIRKMAGTASILSPGLAAIPEHLNVVQGGLALVFCLARHSEQNRVKILDALQGLPTIIEIAREKADQAPWDHEHHKCQQLHLAVADLYRVLVQTIPVLIERLLNKSFKNIARNLYGTYSLAEILNTMSNAAKRVSARARDIIDEVHVRTYETTKTIQQQLDDIARNQVKMQLFMEATSRSEHLLRFVMSQINAGSFPGRGLMYAEPPEPSERSTHRGSATLAPTYTPSELLERLDVNHQQVEADANYMFQKGYATLRPERIERAAGMMTAPEVHRLLGGSTSGMVAVDGYSDGRQMTVITPTGYMVAMLRHCLIEQGWDHRRSRPRYWNWNEQPGSPISPTYEEANDQCIVLAHFCGFHTDEHDPLSGLRGLVRSLAAQLVWGFLYNGWYGHEAPLVLPMSLPPQQEPENNGGDDMSYHSDEDGNRTERDDRASRRYSDGMEGRESDNEEARPSRCTLMLDELCELLQALLQLVPQGASVTCLIDSWSSFECDGMARDYEIVLDTLCSAVAYASDRHNAVGAIKLLLISPVASTWLTDYYRPHADYEDEDGDSGGGGEKDDCYRDGSNSPASSMRVRFPRCFSRVSLRGAIRGGRLGQPPAMTSGFLNGSPAGQDEKAWDVDDDSEADVD